MILWVLELSPDTNSRWTSLQYWLVWGRTLVDGCICLICRHLQFSTHIEGDVKGWPKETWHLRWPYRLQRTDSVGSLSAQLHMFRNHKYALGTALWKMGMFNKISSPSVLFQWIDRSCLFCKEFEIQCIGHEFNSLWGGNILYLPSVTW